MAFDGIYYPHAIQLGASVISGITDFSMSNGIANILNANDGIIDNSFVGVQTAKPTMSFTTTNIGAALDAAGIAGYTVAAGASSVKCYFQKSADGGERSGGANQVLLTATKGIAVPRTITADNESPATITYDIICTSLAGAAPIAVTTGQTLSGAVADSQAYVVGPAAINSAVAAANVDGIQSLSIDFGFTEEVHHENGGVYPVFSGIGQRAPVITLTTMDALVLDTYGPLGVAQTTNDSTFWLKAVTENGDRVADNGTLHISFVMDDGMIQVESGSASSSPGTFELKATPTFDGTAAVLVIDTTADIT